MNNPLYPNWLQALSQNHLNTSIKSYSREINWEELILRCWSYINLEHRQDLNSGPSKAHMKFLSKTLKVRIQTAELSLEWLIFSHEWSSIKIWWKLCQIPKSQFCPKWLCLRLYMLECYYVWALWVKLIGVNNI